MLVKRLLDVIVSGVLILVTGPIMAFITVFIRIDSCGPPIFKQRRIGLDRRRPENGNGGGFPPAERRKRDLGGKPFTMYKFRSMVREAEEMLPSLVNLGGLPEPVYKLPDDPRVTRFGRLLRRTSLDELPQLFNILRGDMSLVGPRPEAERMVFLYKEDHRKRLQAKPGLTGLQQVRCRGSRSMRRRMRYDLRYIQKQSLLMDLWILLKTIVVVIRGNGAF